MMTDTQPSLAAPFTTYRIGGPMDEMVQPDSLDAAVAVLSGLGDKPFTVLGWGSNTIVASRGIRGLTLITRRMHWVTPLSDNRFECGAGAHLAKVAKAAESASLSGAEYMIGIPATVGGAVRMNAGAMGQETSAVVETVTLFDRPSGQLQVWTPEDLHFTYRHSAIDPDRHVVLSVVFRFWPGDKALIGPRMAENIAFRKAHHPTEPNGGSVFQNPNKENPAGKLLDALGAKTWQEGGVRVSPLHANFIINTGTGTSTDLLRLMLRMKQSVQQAFGFCLLPENKLLGDITEEERHLWQALNQEG
jgi:UDP-N-acetylmuramate dehydrogenase